MDTRFDPNQKISSYLAVIFLVILSFAVAWISAIKGKEVIDTARDSETFNIDRRRELINANDLKKGKQIIRYEDQLQ